MVNSIARLLLVCFGAGYCNTPAHAQTTLLTETGHHPAQSPQTSNASTLESMSPAQRVLFFVMKRGTDWLVQAQEPNGLFRPGLHVALNSSLEPAHYLHQVEAAVALAKISRLTGQPHYHAAAQQAMLTLLASTKVDTNNPQIRYTVLPEATVNRLASAGLLLRLIHELPVPVEIRIREVEGLAEYVRSLQLTNGLLQSTPAVQQASSQNENMQHLYEGLALEGLAISQNYCASSWKTELLEKAAHSYPSQELALMALPSFISAFSESYLRKNDPQVAVAVFNMADALCNAQQAPKAGRVSWTGGFMLAQKKDLTQPPSASDSARAISALCDAYRVAKQSGDVQRAEKYKASATAGVQFLTTLQFTAMGIDHLAEDFRPQVLGAFRSHPDSAIIRLQDTAECVLAVSSYLSDVCGLPLNLTPLPQK